MTPSPAKNAKNAKKKKKEKKRKKNGGQRKVLISSTFLVLLNTSICNYFVCKFIELIFLFAFYSGSCYLLCCHMEREGREEKREEGGKME
jgi:hypothetical protein